MGVAAVALILGRAVGEAVLIGPDIVVGAVRSRHGAIHPAITAPRTVKIRREELLRQRPARETSRTASAPGNRARKEAGAG